jgi:hypothetical protein
MTRVIPTITEPQPCKHCDDRIALTPMSGSFLHVEGDQMGKHTCAVDPYGFHAEPIGAPCSDFPANPCNGSRGIAPVGEEQHG